MCILQNMHGSPRLFKIVLNIKKGTLKQSKQLLRKILNKAGLFRFPFTAAQNTFTVCTKNFLKKIAIFLKYTILWPSVLLCQLFKIVMRRLAFYTNVGSH